MVEDGLLLLTTCQEPGKAIGVTTFVVVAAPDYIEMRSVFLVWVDQAENIIC
jgi:uncharacterized lipoprotein YajG